MIKGFAIGLIITFLGLERVQAQYTVDTVSIPSGKLTLKGLLWRPSGHGRFPTVIFCHGSYESNDTIHNPMQEASIVGPVFAKRGYIFLVVFRRGVCLSKGQGQNSADLMDIGF
jgi:hypothetical protein